MTTDAQRPNDDDTPPLPESKPSEGGEPPPGDNQDVAAEKIYPTDPTGADPRDADGDGD
ncbi:hypothetical protein [Cellulomonas sp. URHD0024]|uniref:hypothetical protein n=1 Tax=Cellulomonas sp. URHD0024 TaxID=1302620 RepID=UPI0004252304|nr:hypothetical protein [Cellulomonas sp. URHD0024]